MYLQLDTRFNPFTYDEMVKPLLYYKQAYDEAEAAYSDLATQTEAWKDIANREKSPEAFEMYQRYSGDLSRAVDDFSHGMTAKNRRALVGLKRRYAQDIAPIARASEAMNAANELRVKAGPDAIFEVGEYNSLDQFLHGKTANNRFQSREAITKKTAAMTEAAMAEALKDPEFKKAMGDQFWMITQHTGGSYKELTEAMKLGIMDNPIAQNRFSQIRQGMAKNSGIQNYDAAGQQAIMDAIDTGLYAGLDKPVRNFQNNTDHLNPLQAQSYAQAKEEFKWKKEARQPLSLGDNYYLDPVTGLTFQKDDKGNRVYDLKYKKDPNSSSRSSSTSSGESSQSSDIKFAQLPKSFFYDIKYPNKSEFINPESDTNLSGEPISYGNADDFAKFDDKIRDKTNDKRMSTKKMIDKIIRTHYPGATDEGVEWLAKNYFTILINDDGNITLVPKNIGATSSKDFQYEGSDEDDYGVGSITEGL